MNKLEKLAQKLGISLEELNKRIKNNKNTEEDNINANAKNKNK